MDNNIIKIAILEDTRDIRETLVRYFSEEEFIEVHSVAATAEEMLLQDLQYIHILICDIGLPHMNGIEATWHLKKKYPDLKIIMLTVFEEDQLLMDSLKAGATGYLLKNASLEEIKTGLMNVAAGGAAMGPYMAKKMIEQFKTSKSLISNKKQNLSSREHEIAVLIGEGLTNKEIAKNLFLSTDTIKFHIKNIYLKLQVKNRAHFVKAFERKH